MSSASEEGDGNRRLRAVERPADCKTKGTMSCPNGFSNAGHDPSGFWTFENSVWRNSGACGTDRHFPEKIRKEAFCFSSDGAGVDVDLGRVSGADTTGCMSFGSSCSFQKDAIREIQFRASVSGCNDDGVSVWAAPLWMTPDKWIPLQGTSGEIDFLERCGPNNDGEGFFMNMGAGGTAGVNPRSMPIPNPKEEHTYFVRFENPKHDAGDSVTMWQCPASADPIRDGDLSGCAQIGQGSDLYFQRTDHTAVDEANVFRFVTDIWNVGHKASNNFCNPDDRSLTNKSCRYRVTDIEAKFRDSTTWADDSVCSKHRVSSGGGADDERNDCVANVGSFCFTVPMAIGVALSVLILFKLIFG